MFEKIVEDALGGNSITNKQIKLQIIQLLIPCSTSTPGYTNESFKTLLERAEQVYQWVKVEDKNEKP